MLINHVLAVVPVSDIAAARDWYERLLVREPDNRPMDVLVEWQLTDHGWLQVTVRTEPDARLFADCRRREQTPSPSPEIVEVDATGVGGGREPRRQIEGFLHQRRVRGGVLTHVPQDRALGA